MAGKLWTKNDTKAVATHYPKGGARAVAPHLEVPHTTREIGKKARHMGIRKEKPFQRGEITPALMDALERTYRDGRPDLTGVAKRFNVDRHWLSYVAQTRGIATTKKRFQWGKEVDDIIRQMEGIGPDRVHRQLKTLGYRYPISAIAKRQQYLKVSSVDESRFSACHVAEAFGVSRSRVERWIKTGHLATSRTTSSRGNPHVNPTVPIKALRDFVMTHPSEIDLRLISPAWQIWFIDMLTNKVADTAVGPSISRAA
ncbi:hypothetical protein [Salinicola salarius]|uniref:hypothetical protein n=1 Tax=Salinicola salarius TaxID=430457 RepID=UPI001300844A|nr:hypothetical protein [Salinicola salarius]